MKIRSPQQARTVYGRLAKNIAKDPGLMVATLGPGLTTCEQRLLDRHHIAPGTTIDLGCGPGGQHLIT